MKPNKRFFLPFLCFLLCFLLSLSCFPVFSLAVTDTEAGNPSSSSSDSGTSTDADDSASRIQAAYTFDDHTVLTAEVGGTYPLSTKEFGTSLVEPVAGFRKGGIKGYVHMSPRLFDGGDQFTMGFRTYFTLAEAKGKDTLFLIHGTKKESLELQFFSANESLFLKLTVSDGNNTAVCSYDVSEILSESAQWLHVSFTYRISGSVSLLTLYVNGKSTSSSISTAHVDLSQMKCNTAAFHGIFLDDLYFTDIALQQGKITSLMNQSVDAFYSAELNEMNGETSNPPDDPNVPVTPVEKHNYSWAAYLFDGTFASGTDYHSGDIPAAVNQSCVLIDTKKLSEKYGYAMIRREGSSPKEYLTLDSRLFHGHSSFTFSCWVYRNGKEMENEEFLLDLKGTGVFRFAPYGAGATTPSAYLEYTDVRGTMQRRTIKGGNPADPRNKWVHYALTVSENGEITVYVNGSAVETISSGINVASFAFSQCWVVTGSSADNTTRTAIDEVYVTPKALSAPEIRKIHFYGLERYTSEVLPDPGQTGSEESPSVNPYAPDGVDLAEDAYTQIGSIANGFIATTFDERGNIGRDWNNRANAAITGGRLTQGISSYGLGLDGSSFVRYPIGILDHAQGLTVSLSYFWEGAGVNSSRSQRLFDFSRKTSSVTDPSAYFFLETGNGISGLRFGISDGVSSTYLTCDYNAVNTWTRVTVTVSQGKITLYLNGTVAATGETQVDIASIAPNFCYLGRSGIKGDPMFTGIIDEVYISDTALSQQQVALFQNGISAVLNGGKQDSVDLWGILFNCIIIAVAVLVLVVISVIVAILLRKEKRSSEDDAPVPVSITGKDSPKQTELGPRSAKWKIPAVPSEEGDSTVKFRKVDSDPSPANPASDSELTAKFRKISDDTKR